VDGDHSVKAQELPLLLDSLIEGNDLVVGNRIAKLQEKSALSIHQRAGNFLASSLIRMIWKIQAKMNYSELPVSTLRRIGVSKISGTVKGTIGAAIGIFGKIGQLYFQEARFLASLNKPKVVTK